MPDQFSRTRLLLGAEAVRTLQQARVIVYGVGGVGGFAVEALARVGVGTIDLVDNDTVCLTNINRQIIATHQSVGRYKTEVMAERIHDINPDCVVHRHECFFLPETSAEFHFEEYDYVIDALTERQLDELEQLNEDCKNDERTPFEHWAANETFHLKLMSFWHNDYALQELRLTMNRLTRAYAQFYWNSNRDVLLSKDTEHHTDIIEGLRKKDAATVIEFIRLDLHNFGGFEDFFLQAR